METMVAFRPCQLRLVLTLAVSLKGEQSIAAESLKNLDGLYKHRQIQWGERVGKMLHWAMPAVVREPGNALLEMAHMAEMGEKMFNMPHVGRPVLRVLLREENLFVESPEDAKAVLQKWNGEVKDLMTFFNQEQRLSYQVVLLALAKDLKPIRSFGDGLVDNVLKGRSMDDPRGRVDENDSMQALLLLRQGGFVLLPEV